MRVRTGAGIQVGVAILTRSGDRVQPPRRSGPRHRPGRCDPHPVRRPGAAARSWASRPPPAGCDPHPVRRPGAASAAPSTSTWLPSVAILTRSGDRVQPVGRICTGARDGVAILTRSGDRVQPDRGWRRDVPADVAILTRSGDRVQQAADLATERLIAVAILTRSGDRVQPGQPVRAPQERRQLRSSPGPETGCSHVPLSGTTLGPGRCDPHPVRRPGAAARRQPGRPPMPRCDPHPVRRPGAAFRSPRGAGSVARLRSSPGPETGCSGGHGETRPSAPQVAILTRSGDRVQRGLRTRVTDRGTGCDPHPVRRPGAARAGRGDDRRAVRVAILTRSGDRVQLPPGRVVIASDQEVAILTRSGDRVQHRPPVPRRRPVHRCDPHPVRRPGAAP